MQYIFLNLKRFDIPRVAGGVNDLVPTADWGAHIVEAIQDGLAPYNDGTRFVAFFPEAHILGAKAALMSGSPLALGCQSVHFHDVMAGGNFGAMTTSLPAAAAVNLGCTWVMVGHCEERNKLREIITAGGGNTTAVNTLLAASARCALAAGLNVLYCVGETAEEQPMREQVLRAQLEAMLPLHDNLARSQEIVIAYEPVWAIGPGKTPPDAAYIRDTAQFIRDLSGLPVVYGGGLKQENAPMLAGIDAVSGGLIALTRFTGDIGFYPSEYLQIVEAYHA